MHWSTRKQSSINISLTFRFYEIIQKKKDRLCHLATTMLLLCVVRQANILDLFILLFFTNVTNFKNRQGNTKTTDDAI